jgi:hypothetical protein
MKSHADHFSAKQSAFIPGRDDKKEWKKPHIIELNLRDTKGGFFVVNFETEVWFHS